jgi:adenosylcobinamide-GDP ribazoletransferase
MLADLKTALGFLTILPARTERVPQPGDLGRAAAWFPAVGLLIGLITAAGVWLFSRLFSPLLASALTVGLWILLTGGLHLDGLADCCDGLLSAHSPERRLEIMRDPRLGTFGAVGLFLTLILKILAAGGLPAGNAWFALLLAPMLARFYLLPAGLLTPARSEGLGAQFNAGLSRTGLLAAAILPLAGLIYGGWLYIAAAVFAALAAGGILMLARNRIGGLTGDVLGMLVEVSELAFLLFLNLRLI